MKSNESIENHGEHCDYAEHMMNDMAFAWYSSFELLNIPTRDKEKLMEPIEVCRDGPITWNIIDGHNRFKASSEL